MLCSWYLCIVLFQFADFTFATVINNENVKKRLKAAILNRQKTQSFKSNDTAISSKKCCRKIDSTYGNDDSINDRKMAQLRLMDGSILILIACSGKNIKHFKFTFITKVFLNPPACKNTKAISVFATNMQSFLDSLIFVNFVKTLGYLFLRKKQWRLCLDVFTEFLDAVSNIKNRKYFTYFTFLKSPLKSPAFRNSFKNVVILLLCAGLINRKDTQIPVHIKKFFQLVLKDAISMPRILKEIIIGISDPLLIIPNGSNSTQTPHNESTGSIDTENISDNMNLSNYLNLPAMGILVQLIISTVPESATDIIRSSYFIGSTESQHIRKTFFNMKTKELLKKLEISILTKNSLCTVYYIEFNEMIMRIFAEINSSNLKSEASLSQSMDGQVLILFKPLEVLTEMIHDTVGQSSIVIFRQEIIAAAADFLIHIEELPLKNSFICNMLIKCLSGLKMIFLRYFLAFLGHLYKTVIINASGNSTESLNKSIDLLKRINFIEKIDNAVELLKEQVSKNETDWNTILANVQYPNDFPNELKLTESYQSSHNNIAQSLPQIDLASIEYLCPLHDQSTDSSTKNYFVNCPNQQDNFPDSNSDSKMQSITLENNSNLLVFGSIADESKNTFAPEFVAYLKRTFNPDININSVLLFSHHLFNNLNLNVKIENVFSELIHIQPDFLNNLIIEFQISLPNIESDSEETYRTAVIANFLLPYFNKTIFKSILQCNLNKTNCAGTSASFSSFANVEIESFIIKIANFTSYLKHHNLHLSEQYQEILVLCQQLNVSEKEFMSLVELVKDFTNIHMQVDTQQ